MTRSNLYITLSNGDAIVCVADNSSAPEQGYIVENLLLPLLTMNDGETELALLRGYCTMNDHRINATYRYEINLPLRSVGFYEERYFYKTDVFMKGKNLTHRYIAYLESIASDTAKFTKERFKRYSNQALINRANRLPDFKWDDEGVELTRRSLLSNGAFVYEMRGNKLVIIKDEPVAKLYSNHQ
jgi:hypothetical protein